MAGARLSGKILPPDDLIQVEGTNFVLDGQRCISAAKELGENYVDAEVKDLDC